MKHEISQARIEDAKEAICCSLRIHLDALRYFSDLSFILTLFIPLALSSFHLFDLILFFINSVFLI